MALTRMRLDLTRIRGDRDRFDVTYEASAFPAEAQTYAVIGPVTLGFDISKDRRRYRFVGRVWAPLQLSCGRCLESFTCVVDPEFDLCYVPQVENTGEGEREVEEDDLTTAYYSDDVIDLAHLMREQFYLALPLKPLCAATCRGLCPECGANLNVTSCGCSRTWEDPRLTDLRSLQNNRADD